MEEFQNILINRELREKSLFKDSFNRSSYNIQSLKKTGELNGHSECVNTINFNPTGDLMVTGSDDETIKIWNFNTRTCLQTLYGHKTNVFAANFLPHKSDREIVSGGNDADIRHFDLVSKTCTVYRHHQMKVLKISVNPTSPDTFLSCSGDGTVRMFDIRMKYNNSYTEPFQNDSSNIRSNILPQMYGGGRPQNNLPTGTTTPTSNNSNGSNGSSNNSSLLVNFNSGALRRSLRLSIQLPEISVFSLDFHPYDGYSFITALSDSTVRLFDLRNISDHSSLSYVNIYRNLELPWPSQAEATGCVFSKDGKEILTTYLSDLIYLFDVNKNYSKEYNIDFFKDHSLKTPKKKRRAIHHHRGRKKLSKHRESNNENVDLSNLIDKFNKEDDNTNSSNNNNNNNSNNNNNKTKNDPQNFSLRKTQTNININRDENNTDNIENDKNDNTNLNEVAMNQSDSDDEQVEISYDNLMAIDFYEEIMKQYGGVLKDLSDTTDDDSDSYYGDDSDREIENNSTNENTYSYDSENDDYGYNYDDDDDDDDDEDDDYYNKFRNSKENYISSSTASKTTSSNPIVSSSGSSISNGQNSTSSFSSNATTTTSSSGGGSNLQSSTSLPKSYISKYDGHISAATIKSCSFYGPNSEFVMSGSDDGRVYIWNKNTCKLIRVLEGHHDCVNSIVQHPTLPSIVTSGIDSEAFIWEPEAIYPSQQKLFKRSKDIDFLIKNKLKRSQHLNETTDNLIMTSQCSQQ